MQQNLSPSLPDTYQIPAETVARLGGPAQVRLLLADAQERDPPSDGRVERPVSVRMATVSDEPDLLDLFTEAATENGGHVATPSPERIMQHIQMGTRGRGGFVPVIDGLRIIAGAAIIIPTPWWFSDDHFLNEISLFVRPGARNTRAAADLLDYQRWLGQEMSEAAGHQIFAVTGVTASSRVTSKCRLHRRHMSHVGATFMWPPVALGNR